MAVKPSSETKQALIVHGTWSDEWRKHPALRFMEAAARDFFDSLDHSKWRDWHTAEDFSHHTPHAEELTEDGESDWNDTIERFFRDTFTAFAHHPYLSIVLDTQDGYDLYTQYHLFANLKGGLPAGDSKVKDPEGKDWDIKIPIFYHFDIVREKGAPHEGLKIRHLKFIKDTGLVNAKLDKRGFQKAQ